MSRIDPKLVATAYVAFRSDRVRAEHQLKKLSEVLKKWKKRKIKCDKFTIFVDDSSRSYLPRQAVVNQLGEAWVRAHQKTTKFRMVRVVWK
ncbi:MAG: hypothetical protein EBR40_10015 [Proteobacteria bacterium]|nr:hypothetical protein [Pseudomonadota bacterium]